MHACVRFLGNYLNDIYAGKTGHCLDRNGPSNSKDVFLWGKLN